MKMFTMGWEEISRIKREILNYDAEVAHGITHDRNYSIKMEQYRIVLMGRPGG